MSAIPLETRIQRIEDTLAIYNLIAAYAPAVDSFSDHEAAQLWTEDGIYYLSGIGYFQGHDGIERMLAGREQQWIMDGGGCHVLSMPYLLLDDARAVATNTGRIYLREGERHLGYRVVASRWECVRTDQGWKVKHRYNELFAGAAERARQLIGMRNQWKVAPEFLKDLKKQTEQ